MLDWSFLCQWANIQNQQESNKCDPLCEIQAKVSKSNYEITSFKVSTINFTIIKNFDMTLLSQY